MRKLKSVKNVTRKRTGFVELEDDFVLPLKTLSIAQEAAYQLESTIYPPANKRRPTNEEIELLKQDPNFNPKMSAFIIEYDYTDAKYLEKVKEQSTIQSLIDVIKYVDLDYEIEPGVTLWDDIGVKTGDYWAACKHFAFTVGLTAKDIEMILLEIRALKGETVFEKLSRFEKMTKTDPIKLLNYISEGMKRDLEIVTSSMTDEERELLKEIEEDLTEIEK